MSKILLEQDYFDKVKNYLLDLEYVIVKEDKENGIFIIEKEDEFVKNMIIAVDDTTVIIEQVLFKLKNDSPEVLKKLLKKNRDMISGALALDDNDNVIYRDTLQVENLDLNELETSIDSLNLLLSESGEEFLKFAKGEN